MTVTTLDPATALVVVDLQQGIVGAPLVPHSAADVVARTAELAAAFREHGRPVVLVRMTGLADGSDSVRGRIDGGLRPPRPMPAGFDVLVEAVTGPSDIVVTKRNWGAFYGTDLDLQLRRRGITQLVIAGIATSIGVESTARAAHEHGYHVTLAVDAMTDIDAETHRNSVERVFPRLAETGTVAEIIDLLTKAAG
jgi:nicotinamidase-related amidase